MAIGDLPVDITTTLALGTPSAQVRGAVCHAIGDFFCVVRHENSTTDTILSTFKVDAGGGIHNITANSTIDTEGAGGSPDPDIIKVADGTVAVAMQDPSVGGPSIQTFTIDAAGAITAVATLDVGTGTAPRMFIQKIQHKDMFAVTYFDSSSDLQVSTITIDSAGVISAILATLEITAAPDTSDTGRVVWTGQGTYHACCYTDNASQDGFLATFTVDADGILGTITDTFEFDTSEANHIDLSSNDNGILVVWYDGPGSGGDLDTVIVSSAGVMSVGDNESVAATSSFRTYFTRLDEVSKNVFLLAQTNNLRTYSFDSAGTITAIDSITTIGEVTEIYGMVHKPSTDGADGIVVGCSHLGAPNLNFSIFTLFAEVNVPIFSAYVEVQGTMHLDGFEYKTKQFLKSQRAPAFAPKQVIGNLGMDSHLDLSYLRFDDWSEGIGLEEFFSDGGLAPKRAWFSTCDLSNEQHLVLGPLVNTRANLPGDSGTPASHPIKLLTIRNELYALITNTVSATQNNRVYKLDNGANSWSLVQTTGSAVGGTNHGTVGIIGGTEHIVHAARTDYGFSVDGASWGTDSTQNVDLVTIWDNRLWGVDSEGNAFYSYDPGTEVAIAPVPIPPSSGSGVFGTFIGDLFVSLWVDGNEHLFASTGIGLFKYDIENDRWLLTNVKWPQNRFAGHGSVTWNGDMYIPAGMGMFKVITGPTVNVSAVGPDRDHGIPQDTKGAIVAVESGFNSLFAMATTTIDNIPHVPATAKGTVFSWNGKGWQVMFQTDSPAEDLKSIHLSSAYDTYRLWIAGRTGADLTVRYIDLPVDASNPNQVTGRDYAVTSFLESPWYKVGEDVVGLGLAVAVEVQDTTIDETIKVEFATDFSSQYTTLGVIVNADGTTEYGLPNKVAPKGVAFVAIRFKVTLVRGSTTTLTPHVRALTLKFLKLLPERWHFSLTLDISGEVQGQSERDQWTNLRTSINKNELLEFTFKDNPLAASINRHWVQVTQREGDENTGWEFAGEARLLLSEPQHLHS